MSTTTPHTYQLVFVYSGRKHPQKRSSVEEEGYKSNEDRSNVLCEPSIEEDIPKEGENETTASLMDHIPAKTPDAQSTENGRDSD